MPQKINWGILGAGAIADAFAKGLATSQTGVLHAVGSRSKEKANTFADKFSAPNRHGSYEALLADKSVDAIYIGVPHPLHAEWAIKAAEAKKHVLVEKPFAINFHQATAIIEAAIANDVMLMEAFMYRCHPQTAKLVELIKTKTIGDVRVIQATFSFHAGFNADSRLFKNDLIGGGIMDVGCYPVSISRLIAGAATGKDFADPLEVKATAHLGQTGVDEWAIASAKFPGDILAQLSTGIAVNQENVVRIYGSEGRIFLPTPWAMNRSAAEPGKIIVHKNGEKEPREITIEATVTSFSYEADVFGNAVLSGKKQAPSPAMSWDDTLGNLRMIDSWRQSIGLMYDTEKPENLKPVTVANRPLQKRSDAKMKYGTVPHLDKKVSRLVFGCDNQTTISHGAIVWDDYFSRGGNTFDTAYIYGGGTQERLLGQWIATRGVRDQVVLISKGAHTPNCDPKSLTKQLLESFDRLKVDSTDLYIMHRDNPEIPTGEFIDVLNEHVTAGRIKAFGGSNWSLPRVTDANEYARKNNKQGFSVVSNNFSLARMVDAIWGGCVGSADAESRAWFAKTQIPLFAWSSQSRGFFLPGKAAPEKKDDAELVRCWYAEDNFRRLDRVNEMAKKRNVLPINIALAYVLNQPFPTFPLIGPRQLSETRTSLQALDIELSEKELAWLDLRD
jgi:predicted dehydrogenase/aryl-alcohol dehydrogenase-like predicted oxidoreductase